MAGPILGAAPGPAGGPGVPRSSSRPSLRNAVVVFQYKHFRYLFLSSMLAFTGMQMQQLARGLLAWELTGSFGATGLVALSFGLPMLLFSLIGGALSDRMEKRNLVLATQGANALLALAHAIPVAMGTMSFELLFILGLVQGTAFALGMPARTPLMADAVGQQHMMSAIAMSNAAMNTTRLFGPAVAGILIAGWGIESAYYAQAVVNGLATLVLIGVPTGLGAKLGHRVMGHAPRGSMAAEIGKGLRYTLSHARLRLLMGMMFVVALFAMPHVMLLPGFVTEDLGRSERDLGILSSISGAGAIVASIAIATMTGSDRKPLMQWFAGIGGGLSLAWLGIGSDLFGYAGAVSAVIVIGLAFTAYQTLNVTMMMDETDPEYYGRVQSVNMISFSVMPLMAFPLGIVADIIGASMLFVVLGLLVAGFITLSGILRPGYTFGRDGSRAERDAARAEGSAVGAGSPGGGG